MNPPLRAREGEKCSWKTAAAVGGPCGDMVPEGAMLLWRRWQPVKACAHKGPHPLWHGCGESLSQKAMRVTLPFSLPLSCSADINKNVTNA